MYITSLLSPETIKLGVQASDKEALIEETIRLIEGQDQVTDPNDLRNVILAREKIMSTGVGKGLGLPHGKTSSMKGSVAAMTVSKEPVDFESFDGQPVRIVFLLVGPPEAQTVHIRTLSRISRLMNNVETRTAVLEAESPQDVYDLLCSAEQELLKSQE